MDIIGRVINILMSPLLLFRLFIVFFIGGPLIIVIEKIIPSILGYPISWIIIITAFFSLEIYRYIGKIINRIF